MREQSAEWEEPAQRYPPEEGMRTPKKSTRKKCTPKKCTPKKWTVYCKVQGCGFRVPGTLALKDTPLSDSGCAPETPRLQREVGNSFPRRKKGSRPWTQRAVCGSEGPTVESSARRVDRSVEHQHTRPASLERRPARRWTAQQLPRVTPCPPTTGRHRRGGWRGWTRR